MPSLTNIGLTTQGLIIWDGTASTPRDITRHVNFGFVFEVVTAPAADVVFNVRYHDAADGDLCTPGAAVPVPEVSICDTPAVPGPQATVTIPADTPAGTVFVGTLPCRPGRFLSLASASADANDIRAVIVLDGVIL